MPSTDAKPVVITENVSFRPAYDSPIPAVDRPLAVVYGWLVAKSRHMHKYGDFYLSKGFDVVHIKVNPQQLLRPSAAQKVVQHLVDFMGEAQRKTQPILIHGFSVGAYLYGETLVKLLRDPKQEVAKQIRCQILDSPVDLVGLPHGFGQAVSNVPMFQNAMKHGIELYLKMMKKQYEQYKRSSDTFRGNPLGIPTLFLYSRSDHIAEPAIIEEVMKDWEKRDIPVMSRCWDNSPHVSHFQHYPLEYIAMLNTFLQTVGLVSEKDERIVTAQFAG